MDLSAVYPPHVLRDYALLADGERGAVVGPRGDISWLCLPSWDSDPVMSLLVGGAGCYAVSPLERHTWGGYYDRRSLIWNSRWVTTDGIVESREALALPGQRDRAVVLRRIRALDGSASIRVVLDVRAGFGVHPMHVHQDDERTWTGRSGAMTFRWTGAGAAHRAGAGPLVWELEVRAGDEHDLVLEVGPGPCGDEPLDAARLWSVTEARWRDAVPELGDGAVGRRDAEQAVAVLSGLTSASGGMVAAATTSLPERADEGRNYDYRYAWIRDQSYAGIAASRHGSLRLLDAAVRFVADRLREDGPQLRPAYRVDGGPVPDQRLVEGLKGYPGAPERVGNWANRQFQLDAFGEALELFAAAAQIDHLEPDDWAATQAAVRAIEARWTEPDAGIWELDDQRWAHSRLTCVSGLRAIAAHAPANEAGRWSGLADAILADVSSDCLHPDGRWQRTPVDDRIDASLLLPAIRGALPAEDPRSLATVAAVEAQLTQDRYVYRFRPDGRPLGEAEGAFLLCGFLLSLAKQQQGDLLSARALFERNRAASGSPGLLSEEFDVGQRQLRGNLPQAFVHALLLECSAVLGADDVAGGLRMERDARG